MCHHDNVLTGLVVHVAVGKHCVKVFNTLLGRMVEVVLKPFFNCTKVHGVFDDFMIVWNVEFDGVYGCLKGPTELVTEDRLHHGVLQVGQLVRVPARSTR